MESLWHGLVVVEGNSRNAIALTSEDVKVTWSYFLSAYDMKFGSWLK